jgi:histidinol-phosphate aminotransferase
MPMGYAVAPKRLAASLKRNGVGAAHSLNRLALAAAAASLRDPGYVDGMRLKVVEERQKWHALLDTLGRRRSDSRGNFVFFETGQPHAAQLIREGIEIARAFPPFDQWIRWIPVSGIKNSARFRPEEQILAQLLIRHAVY